MTLWGVASAASLIATAALAAYIVPRVPARGGLVRSLVRRNDRDPDPRVSPEPEPGGPTPESGRTRGPRRRGRPRLRDGGVLAPVHVLRGESRALLDLHARGRGRRV